MYNFLNWIFDVIKYIRVIIAGGDGTISSMINKMTEFNINF